MNGEEDFCVENTEETERSPDDICVLLLDSDVTCLANLEEMIRKCGYQVVATTKADDVPLIIKNKDKKVDLVLAEFCLIEMNKYELLEKIRLICEIPVVVAGAYVKDAIVECLCRGAKFYLKKPLMEGDLKNLLQFTVRKQRDFLSPIDNNPPEKTYLITHTQSLGDEPKKNNNNNEVKTEGLDEYEGENFESGDQKKPELRCPEMQNEFRETDGELRQVYKRKEGADTDTGEQTGKDCGSDSGEQKKPKLIGAENQQDETLEAVPNMEEANYERKEPAEIKKDGEGSEKKKPELVFMEEELEKWSTQPVTDFSAYVESEFQDRDFQPLESIGESVSHHEIPLSPRESSNKNVAAQLQMQTHGALDEELMQDGISLSDLEFDLQEGQGSTSDLEKKATQELFDEIFTDLVKELKP